MKIKIYTTILLLLGVVCSAAGMNFMPVISNYTDADYGAQLPNWCAAQDSAGICYFGNNEGLLSFDGYKWELTKLPEGTTVRSLYIDGDKIFVGTFQDFGYFTRDNYGDLVYTSLAASNPELDMQNEDIWSITQLDNDILFQSFDDIYSYNTSTGVTSLLPNLICERPDNEGDGTMHPLFFFRIGGKLYAQRVNGSFYRFENGGWSRYWHKNVFGSHIVGVVVPPEAHEAVPEVPDGTLIFTVEDMIYKVINGSPVPFQSEINPDLKGVSINRVATGSDGSIYVGTIGNGILRIDRDGRKLAHYDISRGLQNNTVLGLLQDRQGNLWATLNDGISLIYTSEPINILHPRATDPTIGMSYDVAMRGHNLLVATNQGCYAYDAGADRFSLVPNTLGQNWSIFSSGDQTFIGGNERTTILQPHDKIETLNMSGTDFKEGLIHNKEVLLQSSYYSLGHYLRGDEGKWTYAGVIKGLDAPVRQLEIDNDGTVWATHLSKGVYKLKINPDFTEVADIKFYPSLDNDSVSQQCFVMKIRGQVFFAQDNRLYLYDEMADRFMHHSTINDDLRLLSGVISAQAVDDNHFWLACSRAYLLVRYNKGHYRVIKSIPFDLFPRHSNGDNSTVTPGPDGEYYLTLNEGIGLVTSGILHDEEPVFPLSVRSIGALDMYGNMIKLPIDDNEISELEGANLQVNISYPNYSHLPYRFRYIRSKKKHVEVDSVCESPSMLFPTLSSGSHNLHCGIIDVNGDEIQSFDYSVEVPTLWPLRWWAICLYILIFAGALFLIAKLYTRRIVQRRQMDFDAAKAEQDRQIQQQALIIAEQQKQLLESQLSEKSKELASMAFSAYARSQAIENMRASLADIRLKGTKTGEAERVLREISHSEGDNRLFWDVFERNFDLIHEHFFRNLRQEFPSLTPSDMKFCALLRMNMSTKEIARFVNISLRGIETARYRLRKKFGLDKNQSLVKFLIEFHPSS